MDEVRVFPVVELTRAAREDLADIDKYTGKTWGKDQADLYLTFLFEIFDRLASGEVEGSAIVGRGNLYVYLAKLSTRRSARGHRIVHRKIEGGIRVLRIIHTSMNLPAHLEDV